jgi:3-hydroxyacyl-CoA dehydrogenase
MLEDGLTVEEVDALTGPVVGHAKSATLRTMDVVGLDTFAHVVRNVYQNAPDDERRELMKVPEFVERMLEKGYLGQKTGSGFYKKTSERDDKGRPVIWAIDPATLEYRPPMKPRFDSLEAAKKAGSLEEKIRILHTGDDKGARFAWSIFANTAQYAGMRIPEVSDDIVNVDNACKWGFAWEVGLFETWDILGVKYVCDRMRADGLELPPIAQALLDSGRESFYKTDDRGRRWYFDLETRDYKEEQVNPRVLRLASVKKSGGVVKQNDSCSLVDLGDGILCAEFHTKMNTIDADLQHRAAQREGVARCSTRARSTGWLSANQGEHFSAGANIMLMVLGVHRCKTPGTRS